LELPVPPSWPTAVHGMPSPPAATARTSAPGALGSRQSVQETVLAGGGGVVGAGLGTLDPPPVHPAAVVVAPATSKTIHRRRNDVTFAPYRRSPDSAASSRSTISSVAVRPGRPAQIIRPSG
jgi:hypothetical protein